MLTAQGITSLVAGAVALVVGRIFGVLELFIIGAGFLVAPLLGWAYVIIRRPQVEATRWIHPRTLVAGDTGRVDIQVRHQGRLRSSPFELAETVHRMNAPEQLARLQVGSLKPRSATTAGYHLPTARRGMIDLGPLLAVSRDPLGLARWRVGVAGLDSVIVSPRTHLLEMPELGQGALGRELLNQARRLGPGDFHSLREYAEGDEPRSIHWRASARSENLLVKQHTVEGVRRCTVILDTDPESYSDDDSFERAVIATASLVHSADRSGLTTRCVVGGEADLRGPEVVQHTLRLLAQVRPQQAVNFALERDPGEGLGILVAVSGSRTSSGWRIAQGLVDPTQTALSVSTDVPSPSTLDAAARTETEFLASWRSLTGQGRLDLAPDDPVAQPA
jgi:uncharacterized protein (DUF58 family)